MIYDINRPGVELARLHEHSRQVHRVGFNPYQGALLLSGSQDATIRLWDLRALARDESVMTCRSVNKYPGNNEGVRDLRWSPTEGVEFAAGTDNGVVQRWDIQKPNAPLLKLNAHEKSCYSIDWHPDGKHLASGGADKNIKIWDISSTDRRMKTCWQLRAPKPVHTVRWRPATWRSEDASPGHWNSTQLATSYDNQDLRVHIWDLRRPFVPSRELDRFETAPTAMLWHSQNLLWSVDIAGNFLQTSINLIDRHSNKRTPSTMAVAPDGRLVSFLERRFKRGMTIAGPGRNSVHTSRRTSNRGEKLSSSYSATDGSFEDTSLLSSSFKARRRKAPSTQSSRSLASTPPSAGSGGPVLNLDEALLKENLFQSRQLAAYGRIGGVFDADPFIFLACRYHLDVCIGLGSNDNVIHSLPEALAQNANLAGYAGQYRLAQSWRIVGLALQKELKARADRNFARRELCPGHSSTDRDYQWLEGRPVNGSRETHPVRVSRPQLGLHSTKQVASLPLESGSNIATPLVRPVSDVANKITPPVNRDDFNDRDPLALPEPRFTKRSPQKAAETISALSQLRSPPEDVNLQHSQPPLEAYPLRREDYSPTQELSSSNGDVHDTGPDMSNRPAVMENYRANRRPVLRLEDSIQAGGNDALAPRFDRHDSNESFQMFSASTDSSHRARSMLGSFDSNPRFGGSEVTPQRWSDTRPNDGPEPRRLSVADSFRDQQPFNSTKRRSEDSPKPTAALLNETRPLERPAPRTRIINHEDTVLQGPCQESDIQGESGKGKSIYTESDFLPSPEDPLPVPWTATAMVRPLIDYHLEKLSDVQLPAHLLLLLGPYVEHGISAAVQTSIYLSYHNQLVSLSLYTQAAQIRKKASSQCSEVGEHGTYGITAGGPWCTKCNKASKGDRSGFCSRCQEYWADCPICDGEGPMSLLEEHTANDERPNIHVPHESGDYAWGWCQGCGHGGHVGCLRVWWDDVEVSAGSCPTLGCLHDCVAGTQRAAFLQRKAENKKASLVKGDAWVVGESRAVEKTRGLIKQNEQETTVAQDRNSTRSPRGSRGPLGMAAMGRTGSGGKKVRLVVPHPEQDSSIGGGARGENRTSASAPS